jgi:surface antigen
MTSVRIIATAAIGLSLAGCAGGTIGGPKEESGTLIGAGAGALLGSQIGGDTRARVVGGVAGALIGGLIGNRIGAALDDEDKKRAYAAQIQALEAGPSGAPVAWRNPDSGRYGNIVPGPAYQNQGMTCRPFTHTIYINGQPQVARGNACRNPDGTWAAVG